MKTRDLLGLNADGSRACRERVAGGFSSTNVSLGRGVFP